MPAPIFNGRYQIFSSTAGGTADYVLNGLFFDETATFSHLDVAVGDEILDASGAKYRIEVINTSNPLNVDVTDLETSGSASTGAGTVYRPTTNYDFELATRVSNGVTEFLQQLGRNASIENIDDEINQREGAISTNTTNISTNTGNISTNTTNIGTNTTNIGTNTTNIGTNTSDITDIKNRLDNPTLTGWDTSLEGGVDYNQTAPSSQTITTLVDLTSRIRVGYPIRVQQSSTFRYGVVKAITSSLITIYGAPLLTTASAIQDIQVGPPEKVSQATYVVAGNFNDAAETALLLNDTSSYEYWNMADAYIVRFTAIGVTVGATAPQINVGTGASGTDAVSTSNTNNGINLSTSLVSTEVDINLTNYKISNGDRLEVSTTQGSGDSENLSVMVVFVTE